MGKKKKSSLLDLFCSRPSIPKKQGETNSQNMATKNKQERTVEKRRSTKPASELHKLEQNAEKPPVKVTSVRSLTGSQLDQELMEMLNIPSDIKGMRRIFQANPITAPGKRLQLIRMLGITLVPIIILLGFTGYIFGTRVSDSLVASEIRRTLKFATELAEMMHNLQNERDMSALYVSDISPDVTKRFLVERYPQTDDSIKNLSYWPAIKGHPHYETKDTFYNFLNRHRYELDTKKPTILDELEFYSDAIEVFINWLYSALTEAQSGTVWKDLVALVETVEGLESAGIERALGALFYMRGGFPSRRTYLWFREAQDIGNYTLKSAKDYSEMAAKVYNMTIENESVFFEDIQRMRSIIKDSTLEQSIESNENRTDHDSSFRPQGNFLNSSLTDAKYWFDNMTLYLDAILEIQGSLIKIINDLLIEQANEDQKILIAVATLFAFVIVLSPVILRSVYVLTTDIQGYSVTLAERTKALNKEKQRTEVLLHEMLPRSIADKLKNNEAVPSEGYTSVTLLYAKMAEFGLIVKRSSPNQVVSMLNTLFRHYDKILKQYDVCKVMTIGASTVVASGVPHRNGSSHALEVATLALEFLETTSQLQVPHMPGVYFELRIGCHTGSCVTGVVDGKVPKYCILCSETMMMAEKLQKTSKLGFVQISQAMSELLVQDNYSFSITKRQDELTQLCGMSTYWIKRTGMEEVVMDLDTDDWMNQTTDWGMATENDLHNANPDSVRLESTPDILDSIQSNGSQEVDAEIHAEAHVEQDLQVLDIDADLAKSSVV